MRKFHQQFLLAMRRRLKNFPETIYIISKRLFLNRLRKYSQNSVILSTAKNPIKILHCVQDDYFFITTSPLRKLFYENSRGICRRSLTAPTTCFPMSLPFRGFFYFHSRCFQKLSFLIFHAPCCKHRDYLLY